MGQTVWSAPLGYRGASVWKEDLASSTVKKSHSPGWGFLTSGIHRKAIFPTPDFLFTLRRGREYFPLLIKYKRGIKDGV